GEHDEDHQRDLDNSDDDEGCCVHDPYTDFPGLSLELLADSCQLLLLQSAMTSLFAVQALRFSITSFSALAYRPRGPEVKSESLAGRICTRPLPGPALLCSAACMC